MGHISRCVVSQNVRTHEKIAAFIATGRATGAIFRHVSAIVVFVSSDTFVACKAAQRRVTTLSFNKAKYYEVTGNEPDIPEKRLSHDVCATSW